MANGGQRKEFLNQGILGSGAGVARKRGFRPIAIDNIGSPEYNSRYFETFPTAWATAYAFRKSLEADPKEQDGVQAAAEIEKAATVATREWATLFLLHYFGILQLSVYAADEIRSNYDKDLWLALSGTYPSLKENAASSIKLLETDDHRVVGAYYSEVVFFPSRSRSKWVTASGDSDSLRPYLSDKSLSWTETSRILLKEEQDKDAFHVHLRLISDKVLQSQRLKDRLDAFCDQVFGTSVPEITTTLDKDPSSWDIPGVRKHTGSEYLDRYPFVRGNEKGGKIYYLVSGMPVQTSWMAQVVESAWPAPNQYKYKSPTEISLSLGKKPVVCQIGDNDEIVQLKNLFLAQEPYWCKVPRASETFVAKIKGLHTVGLRDPVIKPNEVAVCLAPVTGEFLRNFPEVFGKLDGVTATPGPQNSVNWTFVIDDREIKWPTVPVRQADMPNTSLAVWPPGASKDWKLYAAYGTGNKETSGRWHLVDETGWKGTPVKIEDLEYVNFLQRSSISNMPKALLSTDSNDNERGILFLSHSKLDFPNFDEEGSATLALDFGTSNTCVAYKNGQSEILKFQLTPDVLWGERPELENAGFVPFQWGCAKGFFPTVLLSRKSDEALPSTRPEGLQVEDLFRVDIPGLHKGLEERLYTGKLNRLWRVHSNLKWDPNPTTPWRSLFLQLTLLYSHAEIFFNKGVRINKYVVTFPLALPAEEQDRFHEKAVDAIRKVRQLSYGDAHVDNFEYVSMDESTAIAGFRRQSANPATMDVFIDVGGGTADIAIRGDEGFLVLDSVKVAGNTFFQFAKKNFDLKLRGGREFKKHLGMLLEIEEQEPEMVLSGLERSRLSFGTFYSVAINGLTEQAFKDREQEIMNKGMGKPASYQRYRSRLFFRHILAYALLQSCAAAVDRRIKPSSGIQLVLGGNAWGLMMFAELPRSSEKLRGEAEEILKLLKRHLSHTSSDEERQYLDALEIGNVQLLNEKNLSEAKIGVALGALNAKANPRAGNEGRTRYAGVTINQLRINADEFQPVTIRWCERWGFDEFKKKFGNMDEINNSSFTMPTDLAKPFDPVLSVFTSLGNTSRNDLDNMPEAIWTNINGELRESITSMRGNRLEFSPISYFVSHVLYPEDTPNDFLDALAEKNNNFKGNPNEG